MRDVPFRERLERLEGERFIVSVGSSSTTAASAPADAWPAIAERRCPLDVASARSRSLGPLIEPHIDDRRDSRSRGRQAVCERALQLGR